MVQTPCEHATTDRKGAAICPRCGARIPANDFAEIMLETLAQLAQFGLDAEGRPLLDRRAEDR
ncbi:MAG: hypothetical protein E6K07_10450 [Methanobacteriota archaeon]|nr:MAG: hypothetical protein AUH46_04425 [Gemmatimonadetes bacterium 13_1_40CM_70_15]OLC75900.1 MAG: hypothetical protein AUH78_07930 [Gemmatimonadetes bacterium 13_1_40CM_4_69_8]PYP72654.1 MAG: hypothetical protein DMD41_08405 [Gemmatimonadota bacterium]TLZ74840.1 MAG: hypothetical protein E6K07_10450 [Euryarchaeota archaeon]